MLSVLNQIVDFFVAVGQLVLNFIMGIIQLLTMIPSALTMLTYSLGYMPTVLFSFAIALVTVSIVYMVVGR